MIEEPPEGGWMIAHEHSTRRYRYVSTDSEDGAALLDWAIFHGIDPLRLPLHTVITRDADGCRIIYQSFTYGPDDVLLVDEIENEPLVEQRIEQGEAPPRPFPFDMSDAMLVPDPN